MQLRQNQLVQFELIRDGIAATDAYLHQLTDYHGGPLQTEYVLTTNIASALLARQKLVATEFLANTEKNHVYYRDKQVSFTLGSCRFDVASFDSAGVLELVVEIKVGA